MNLRTFQVGRRRTGERGAAFVLVVAVTTMLAGIALYAARSAQLASASSGYARQATQAYYLTQYAALATTSYIRENLDSPKKEAEDKTKSLAANCQGLANFQSPRCTTYQLKSLTTTLASQSQKPIDTWSLGSDSVVGNFDTELSGWHNSNKLIPGYAKEFTMVTIVVTMSGRVLYESNDPDPAKVLAAGNFTATNVRARGQVLAGPFPKQ